MDTEITFNKFYLELYTQYVSFETLLYGNFIVIKEFFNEHEEKNESYQSQTHPFNHSLILDYSNVKKSIKQLNEHLGDLADFGYTQTMIYLFHKNNDSLKARVINFYYEWIKKFLYQRGKNEIYKFHSYDWFRVLYVLRNITSHADNFGYKVQFPDKSHNLKGKIEPYPDTIEWKKILITRGQENDVQYDEVQILYLLLSIIIFFANNEDFNPST